MDKLLHLSGRVSYDDNIIHIDKYIERLMTILKLKEEKSIYFGMKTKLM